MDKDGCKEFEPFLLVHEIDTDRSAISNEIEVKKKEEKEKRRKKRRSSLEDEFVGDDEGSVEFPREHADLFLYSSCVHQHLTGNDL